MQNPQIIQQRPKNKQKGICDIVLVVDVTASMGPCIEGLKNNLNSFVDNLKLGINQTPLDWRARVLPFRDVFEDGPDAIDNSNPFVSDTESLKSQINKLTPSGGGELPEGVLDAIYVAITKSDWRDIYKVSRFVVVFTDAPTWETLHNSTIEPGEDNSVNRIKQLIAENHIHLFIFAPNDSKGIYNRLSESPRVVFDRVGDENEQEKIYNGLQNKNFKDLLTSLARSISKQSVVKKA